MKSSDQHHLRSTKVGTVSTLLLFFTATPIGIDTFPADVIATLTSSVDSTSNVAEFS